MQSPISKTRLMLLTGLALAAAACDQTATIRYTQLATCGTYRLPGRGTAGGADLAYLIYRVDAIENTGPRPETFPFNPANFRTGSPSAAPPPASPIAAFTTASARSIEPGQTVRQLGRVAIAYQAADPRAVLGRRVNLYYSGYPNLAVVTNRADPIQSFEVCTSDNVPA